jgi:hypothetical protein
MLKLLLYVRELAERRCFHWARSPTEYRLPFVPGVIGCFIDGDHCGGLK